MTVATKTAETTRAGQAFEEFLDGQLADPVFRAGFERKLAKVKSIAEVLRVIEEVRERENIPKAEIARRMDRKPEAISRLLRGEGSNPTLDTLIGLSRSGSNSTSGSSASRPSATATTRR
jgi:hypothetical protein